MASLVESRKQYYALIEESKKADENQRLSTILAPPKQGAGLLAERCL